MKRLNWLPALLLLISMCVYALVLETLGFPAATILFLIVAFLVMGERRPVWLFGVSVPLVLGFWLLMDQLGIYLYPGDIFNLFAGSR